MPTITLRNVPDDLHRRLKERAARNHRSLNGEALHCLEQAISEGKQALDAGARLEQIRRRRQALGMPRTLTADEVEAAIEEGRS